MSVRILHLEDDPTDAELIRETLAAELAGCAIARAATRGEFEAALTRGGFDLVLSDYALPGFDGVEALRLALDQAPDVPFIFASGTLGEEHAIEMLKQGATDYVLKQRLSRLVPAVRRALAGAADRAARRRAEDEVREKAALLDMAPDAIRVVDLEPHRIRFWNRGAERLYGWTAAEALGRDPTELLYGADPPERTAARERVLATGEWTGELTVRTKHGREVQVESRWSRVRSAGGGPGSILVIDTDITERKALERQFLRAQRLEGIGTLAGGIAHDLNNVLAPITMAVELLRRRAPDERCQRLLTTVEASARRGADMVKQITGFARGVEGERIPLQPRHLLKDLETMVRDTFPKSIELKTSFVADLWTIVGDATQIHQVLLNLCVNARDAMPAGGVLELTAENASVDESYARMRLEAKPGPYVLLGVSDTGSGMASEVVERIFDPFFTTKQVGKGTGLGLSTSLTIVKSHGGFIDVKSEPGRGSSFTVHLPARPGAVEAARVQRPAPATGRGELILVADDEASIREIAQETLESSGYRVLTAQDGAEAVALRAQAGEQVLAAIIDMRMPIMDGPATIRALRMLDAGLKIIATSGLGESDAGAAPAGVQAFLQKPYAADTLLAVLRDVLRSDIPVPR